MHSITQCSRRVLLLATTFLCTALSSSSLFVGCSKPSQASGYATGKGAESDRTQTYANLGGNSGVQSFRIASNSIVVHFRDGASYLYTSESAGASTILHMHELAKKGQGLNGFINRHVRKNYAKKIR